MEPKVTVLTTVYNGLPYLKEAIESTLKQTYSNFEFLMIDDASTDGSWECILSYTDPRVRVVRNQHNIGQVASLNKGLQLARGEFIARLDQDDVNLPDRLKEQLEFLEKHREITIISSWEHLIDSSGRRFCDWRRELKNYGEFLSYILLRLCPIWHPSVMFRKDMIIKLGGFDTSYAPAEDYELWSRIAMERLNAAFVPCFHLLQRVHDKSQSYLQRNKQVVAAKKAHQKVLNTFLNKDTNCIAALLSLENDPCGKKYERKHMSELTNDLEETLYKIKDIQNLSNEEFKSLKSKIYRRMGLGVYFAPFLTQLPMIVFYLFFYTLSPFYFPRFRQVASRIYKNVLRLCYKSL